MGSFDWSWVAGNPEAITSMFWRSRYYRVARDSGIIQTVQGRSQLASIAEAQSV
jgi:hypothetical protein